MLSFLLGALVGAGCLVPLWRRARRERDALELQRGHLAVDRQRVIDFMHLMVEALGEGLTPQELQQRVVHASILCTGALSGCIFERTEGGLMRSAAVEGLFPPHRPLAERSSGDFPTRARFIESVLRSEEFPVGEGLVGRVALTRRAELVTAADRDKAITRHEDPALAVRSLIAVPLSFRSRFFGVLVVANPEGERPFTEVEFTLMQSLGEQAALALHNAEFLHLQIERKQLDLDLAVASGIQQMLLPSETPRVAGLDINARYTPAQKVGGDLYDIFPLSETRSAVVIADVSGKGIPASLLMAICRTHLRQIAPRHDSPAAALRELNRTLGRDTKSGTFVTLVYAVIDTADHEVVFARAGHELPLFARRDALGGVIATDYVGSDGMPLGLVPEEIFTPAIVDHTEPFHPGDVLVLYTDGITEAPNEDGKEFSGARLADVVRSLQRKSARDINDGVLAALQRFTDETAQRDDLTLLTIKAT